MSNQYLRYLYWLNVNKNPIISNIQHTDVTEQHIYVFSNRPRVIVVNLRTVEPILRLIIFDVIINY